MSKSEQLQIRVTASEKATLKRLARQAGRDVSTYVLARALPSHRLRFQALIHDLADEGERRYALAELSDLLARLTRSELSDTLDGAPAPAPVLELAPYWRNYVAAMVEQAAHRKNVPAPRWLSDIEPLTEPHFGTPLLSLRPYLMRVAPVPFRRRNIFVDSSVGDRV